MTKSPGAKPGLDRIVLASPRPIEAPHVDNSFLPCVWLCSPQKNSTELIISFKAATALGLTFPLSVLGRADEVIE